MKEYACRMCKWNSKKPYPRRFKLKKNLARHLQTFHMVKNWPSMIKTISNA